LIIASLIFIISGTFLFQLFSLQSFAALTIFMLLYQTLVAALAASYFPLLAELFPTNVRYTGVAICYNVIYSIAGLVPLLLSLLLKYTQTPEQIVWFFVALSFVSIFAAVKIKTEHLHLPQKFGQYSPF